MYFVYSKIKKNILLSSEFPPLPGGIGNHALSLQKEGNEVTVVTNQHSAVIHEESAFDAGIKIYPNPTATILNINVLDSEISRADIQIFSLDGRLMWQSQTPILGAKETNISTNMAEYPSGMYVVKVKTNNKVVVQKVFKN